MVHYLWLGKVELLEKNKNMWKNFEIFALISVIAWLSSALFSSIKDSKTNKIIRDITFYIGTASLAAFITQLWVSLERPPLRTLGETRLWYSLFIAIIGFIIYKRWNYKLFLLYSIAMALVFLIINYVNPDIHNKALMPALQSPWFVPHVIVYIVSYAFIGFSCLIGMYGIYQINKNIDAKNTLAIADNLIYIGYGFLTLGLVFGALWAKEAWGHYWTWDPKETWAFITWGTYLVYIHIRTHKPHLTKLHLYYISIAFIVLLICWFGINYLPAAQNSVHVYSN